MAYGWGTKIPENDDLREWVRGKLAETSDDDEPFIVTKAIVVFEVEELGDRWRGHVHENCRDWDIVGLMTTTLTDVEAYRADN